MLAYANDIILLGSDMREVIHSLSKLIEASKNMGLRINDEKTKHMLKFIINIEQSNLKVENMSFEIVDDFKYLGVDIKTSNI